MDLNDTPNPTTLCTFFLCTYVHLKISSMEIHEPTETYSRFLIFTFLNFLVWNVEPSFDRKSNLLFGQFHCIKVLLNRFIS